MKEYAGWLFDLYAYKNGVRLCLIGDDGGRHFFYQDFAFIFYARGNVPRLRQLWRFLRTKEVKLSYVERADLFDGPQNVVQVEVGSPAAFPTLFREVSYQFQDLTFYNADVPLPLRYAAAFNVFPLAHCQVTAGQGQKLVSIKALDNPWELDPCLPNFRILNMEPDVDPTHARPAFLHVRYDQFNYRLPLDQPRELLFRINAIFRQYDPDVILTSYGDTWIFSHLEKISEQTRIPFNPNRDQSQAVLKRKEVSFFNYGQAHYRGEQVHLFGRWHVDDQNGMTYSDYGLIGAIEQARIAGLPVQEVARRSPGAGIAAMQTLVAMKRGVLIPYQSQKGEVPKTYKDLFQADRGGLVFEPLPGVRPHVAILDFIMMFPSIMVKYNISPETVGVDEEDAFEIPELGIKISRRPGLVPETLKPLVDKRVKLKRLLKHLDKNHPDYARYKATSKSLKWQGVVSYGREGYANSTFGRINAHEVIGFLGRKTLLQAKGIAEGQGFTFLHGYVDSIFINRPGAVAPEDFQEVVDEIERETGLPIDLEEVYTWMAFVASRKNPKTPVANRFYGLKQDGTFKIRGLFVRRKDTPKFVAETQHEILGILAKEPDYTKLITHLPAIMAGVKERVEALKNMTVPIEDLVITRTLSRELSEYKVNSMVVRAARQLQRAGRELSMGQRIRIVYTLGKPGVFAWDLPAVLDLRMADKTRYKELLLRAVYEVLQPFGITQDTLRSWMFSEAYYFRPEDMVDLSVRGAAADLPLFASLNLTRLEML